MVMLTELLRSALVDEKHRRAQVVDLSIVLLEDDYPPVTHILFHHDGELRKAEWKDVSALDLPRRVIRVKDLDESAQGDNEGDVLLARDILDALVLDLLSRRTTRVCDLWLEEEDGALRLKGVDSGLEALLRRVARGWLPLPSPEALFDWKYVEFLRGDPAAVDNGAGYRLRINRLPAGEIARLADYIPYLHAAELLKLLPDEKAADVLQAMSVERQLQVIEELDEDDAIDLLGRMSPDLATDLVGRMHLATMRRYVSKLPKEQRERIIELLRYPANSVGGVMVNDLVVLTATMSVEKAQEAIEDRIKKTEFVSLTFVVDDEPGNRLRGTVSLRQLLAGDPQKKLEDLMDPYLETLDPYEPAADAAHRIVGGQLEAMPVVNSSGSLIGAMTISAAISLVLPIAGGRIRVFS